MAYDNNEKKWIASTANVSVLEKEERIFFDVRATRGNDYYLTITESRKRFNDNGYDRHKIFLYKEDFNKFLKALTEAVDHVKTELMPDFDFDAFNHDEVELDGEEVVSELTTPVHSAEVSVSSPASTPSPTTEEVDKW